MQPEAKVILGALVVAVEVIWVAVTALVMGESSVVEKAWGQA